MLHPRCCQYGVPVIWLTLSVGIGHHVHVIRAWRHVASQRRRGHLGWLPLQQGEGGKAGGAASLPPGRSVGSPPRPRDSQEGQFRAALPGLGCWRVQALERAVRVP